MERPRWTRVDTVALGLVLLIVVTGALFYPVYHALVPLEAMRARWRADDALYDRLHDSSGEPLWSDGKGGALPPAYPANQGGKDESENMARFEEKLGGFSGRRTGRFAADERHPALPSVPLDAWGRPYWLTVAWGSRQWGVASAGPDGRIDTPDDLQLFQWGLHSWSKYSPLEVDLVIYLGAALFAWLYLVLRALALPRAPLPWEVARAVVMVTPLFAVLGCCVGGAGLQVPTWSDLQVAPAWLSVSLTVSAACVAAIVWRRTRPPVEPEP